jgi:hypothetical protein
MDHLNDLVIEDKKFSCHHPRIIGKLHNHDLPYVKTAPKIPLGAINPEWLHTHPQDPSSYDRSIGMSLPLRHYLCVTDDQNEVMADTPKQVQLEAAQQGFNDEELADDEREQLAANSDEDLYDN